LLLMIVQGKVVLAGTPYLAGSSLQMPQGIANLVRFADLTLAQAVQMASLNPAQFLGQAQAVGHLGAGQAANLVVFAWDEEHSLLTVRETIARGRWCTEASEGQWRGISSSSTRGP